MFIVNIYFPPLFGYWETSTVYFELEKFQHLRYRDYALLIQDGANIAGQYGNHGYPLLRLFNPILLFTGHSFNFSGIRFLPKVYGLLGLFFFGLLVKRKTNIYISCFVVMLLSINFIFFLFLNQLLPLTITFLAVTYTIYMFDSFYFQKDKSIKTISLLGLGYSLLALHYSMGRMLLITLILYQIADMLYLKITKKSFLELRQKFKITAYSWLSFLVILSIFHGRNLKRLFNKEFLFPHVAEVVTDHFDLIPTVLFNLKIFFLEYIFVTPREYFSHNNLAVLTSAPQSFISPFIFILSIFGFYQF